MSSDETYRDNPLDRVDWNADTWGRAYWTAIHPFNLEGAYVNFMMDDEVQGRVQATYGENYERLTSVKAKYDPKNLFRVNQNILPAAS